MPSAIAKNLTPLPVTEIDHGIFVHSGVQQEASAANLGAIANVGFIIGEKCVAVIDTGGSLREGEELRNAVQARTNLPICYVVNTHVHPDHLFGNAAFKKDKPKFVGHAKLPAAMAAREQGYVKSLQRDLGEAATGSEFVPPNTLVTNVLELDLGNRILQLRAWKTAHTDNDLTVYDVKTGSLWLGDLLFVERVPVVDGSVRGWLSTLVDLRTMPVRHAIPGHGPVQNSWPQALDSETRYLSTVQDGVRAAIRARLTLQKAVDSVGTGERGNWLLFDEYHRRNVTAAYAELEWED